MQKLMLAMQMAILCLLLCLSRSLNAQQKQRISPKPPSGGLFCVSLFGLEIQQERIYGKQQGITFLVW